MSAIINNNRVLTHLYYDVVSPYSWIAFELLCRYRPQWPSMSLKLKPVFLPAVFKGAGNPTVLENPSKAKYLFNDVHRLGKYYKIPIRIPDNFIEVASVKTSLKAMRFITAVDMITDGKSTEDLSRQLSKRVFKSHQDVTLADSLREASQKGGLNEKTVEKALVLMEKQEVKDALRKTTDELVSIGGYGVPTIVVHLADGPELVFGSDRMELIGSLLGEKYVGPLNKYSQLMDDSKL
ncbi:glutathione S-transferase kappa 1-like [Oppia nitens]|uniref:glutathione S-transferase kappa 1-like n=1 Tax=Oppia nitens TaxID=1686743 RepID=UPI0023DA729C|nr:glutathione S-transferase kappa 1-like [Oppia nitens]